jgi:hypothetical protein
MAVPAAAGYPDQSGVLIGEKWSSTMLAKYYLSTVWNEITNTDFDEMIGGVGDVLHILETPDIIIEDGQKLGVTSQQKPAHTEKTLTIDKAKTYRFIIEDIDRFNSHVQYQDDIQTEATMKMGISIDQDVLSYATTQVHASNSGATAGVDSDIDLGSTGAPIALTRDNILDYISNCEVVLSEQNAPDDGRWMVLPPWAVGLLDRSELSDTSVSGTQSTIFSGRLGVLHGFTIYRNRSLTKTTDNGNKVQDILFGHMDALSFASNFTKHKVQELIESFGTQIAGLQVYGRSALKPEVLGSLYGYKGA